MTGEWLSNLGVVGLWSVLGVLVLTRRLVWHTDLRKMEAERDEWRHIALRGLGLAEQTTAHAEILARRKDTRRKDTDP